MPQDLEGAVTLMLRFGTQPYIECSTKGDKRFSAFCARPRSLRGKSIEEAYQAMKVFADGTTGLTWHDAKGKRGCVNLTECYSAYRRWWREWVKEQKLEGDLILASGLSDVFGQSGHICQAEVLWNIREELRYGKHSKY